MIHEIEEIDYMFGTPLACTRLHELRLKNNSLHGSYGTSQPEVGVRSASEKTPIQLARARLTLCMHM